MRKGRIKKIRAEALGISRKNLYHERRQEIKDLAVKALIHKSQKDNSSYGQERIALDLKLNKKRNGRIMRKYNIPIPRRIKKKFRRW